MPGGPPCGACGSTKTTVEYPGKKAGEIVPYSKFCGPPTRNPWLRLVCVDCGWRGEWQAVRGAFAWSKNPETGKLERRQPKAYCQECYDEGCDTCKPAWI